MTPILKEDRKEVTRLVALGWTELTARLSVLKSRFWASSKGQSLIQARREEQTLKIFRCKGMAPEASTALMIGLRDQKPWALRLLVNLLPKWNLSQYDRFALGRNFGLVFVRPDPEGIPESSIQRIITLWKEGHGYGSIRFLINQENLPKTSTSYVWQREDVRSVLEERDLGYFLGFYPLRQFLK